MVLFTFKVPVTPVRLSLLITDIESVRVEAKHFEVGSFLTLRLVIVVVMRYLVVLRDFPRGLVHFGGLHSVLFKGIHYGYLFGLEAFRFGKLDFVLNVEILDCLSDHRLHLDRSVVQWLELENLVGHDFA